MLRIAFASIGLLALQGQHDMMIKVDATAGTGGMKGRQKRTKYITDGQGENLDYRALAGRTNNNVKGLRAWKAFAPTHDTIDEEDASVDSSEEEAALWTAIEQKPKATHDSSDEEDASVDSSEEELWTAIPQRPKESLEASEKVTPSIEATNSPSERDSQKDVTTKYRNYQEDLSGAAPLDGPKRDAAANSARDKYRANLAMFENRDMPKTTNDKKKETESQKQFRFKLERFQDREKANTKNDKKTEKPKKVMSDRVIGLRARFGG